MNKQPNWLDKTEYPFESKFIYHNQIAQHYIDEGSGDPILFVHGTPSWSFDFRKIIAALKTSNRCIAIDHIGFGLSDKPADYDYSLNHHIQNTSDSIQQLNLKNITLVLHDFGGPIGLEYALKNPENIKQIIILNSWIGSSESEPEFKKLKKILKSPLLPFLYLRFNFSARFLLPGSFGKNKLIRKIRKQFTSAFPDKKSRHGTLGFAKSLLNDQDFFESQLQRASLLTKKPLLLIWGMEDKFVGKTYLERFQKCFPKSKTLSLEHTGHFPQEENSAEVIEAIQKFIQTSPTS